MCKLENRRAGDLLQPKFRGLRTRGGGGGLVNVLQSEGLSIRHPNIWEQEKKWTSQLKTKDRTCPCSHLFVHLGFQWNGWCPWARTLFPSLLIQILISSKTTAQTHPEITLYQLSSHPLAQCSGHMKLTITESIPLSPMGKMWREMTKTQLPGTEGPRFQSPSPFVAQ